MMTYETRNSKVDSDDLCPDDSDDFVSDLDSDDLLSDKEL